jgi:hypothetical protein
MGKAHRTRTRRVRRQSKQTLHYGDKAKRTHAHLGGRTGSIRSKSTPSATTTTLPATSGEG